VSSTQQQFLLPCPCRSV
jgi:hypothetical protein